MTALFTGPPAGIAATPSEPDSGWVVQTSGSTVDLAALSFPEVSVGYVVGPTGTIFATVDGGGTWTRQAACRTPGPCSPGAKNLVKADLTGVSFSDRSHGLVVGKEGTILTTDDGGRTWTPKVVGTKMTTDLYGVSFPDVLHGFVIGSAGTILRTSDGGVTWTPQFACQSSVPCIETSADRVIADLAAVAFSDALHGFAVGAAGTILTTRNGGRIWAEVPVCPGAGCQPSSPDRLRHDLRAVAVADPTHGVAVGVGGTILTTSDGLAWLPGGAACPGGPCQPSSPDPPPDLAAVSLAHAERGRIAGSAGYTADFGPSGVSAKGPSAGALDLAGVEMPDPNTAYAVGKGGAIYRASSVPGPARVSDVEPRSGLTAGGAKVVIRGSKLSSATAVTFGRRLVKNISVTSDGEISVIAPVHGPGEVEVSVLTPMGDSAPLARARYRYDEPTGGAWSPGPPCDTACRSGVAVSLPNGKVLAVGSGAFYAGAAGTASPNVEIFDVPSATWAATEPLNEGRNGLTATVLDDGRVLVVGGLSALQKPLASAEVYDPRTGAWQLTGPLTFSRFGHTATLMNNGHVLVTGGAPAQQAGQVASAEVYDPASGQWTTTATPGDSRSFHTATALRDGTVLVAGGISSADALAPSAEIYDPTAGQWRLTRSPAFPRAMHSATLLGDGKVLVAGGTIFGQVALDAEVYDPAAQRWTKADAMAVPRALHTAVLLADGRVMVTGGNQDLARGPVLPFVEIYDPTTDRWQVSASMGTARDYHSATLLDRAPCGENCGKVLIAGGVDCRYCLDPTVPTTELFDPVEPAPAAEKATDATLWPWALAALGAAAALAGGYWIVSRRSRLPARPPPSS